MKPKSPFAYQLEATPSGGYQLVRFTLDEDIVTARELIDSPDSWDMVISYLEKELSQQFA
jgi:hypothetical protein